MKKFWSIFLLCIPALIFAQTKTLTVEDAVLNRKIYPKRLPQLAWRGESNDFVYYDSEKTALVSGNAKSEPSEILKLADLSAKVKAAGGDELTYMPPITWITKDEIRFQDAKFLWKYTLSTQTASKLSEWKDGAENQDFAKDGSVAYTIDGNIYVYDNKTSKVRQITLDGKYQTVYGSSASRNEFGIEKGLFWSNQSDKLAFYRINQGEVTDYPLAQWTEMPAKNKDIKYPMAGAKTQCVWVGIYDTKKGKTVYLQPNNCPDDSYKTNITWSPDGKYLYVAVVNRDQNEMKLNQYDSKTGKLIKTLFTETHPKYVEPEHGLVFLPESNEEFLWYSERDGFQHLYHYNTDGKLIAQLTKGDWMVNEILGFDKKGKHVFVSTTQASALEANTYKIDLKSGVMNQLTFDKGVHFSQISTDGEHVLDIYSSLEVPAVVQILDADGKTEKQILKAENPLKDYKLGKTEFLTLKSTDGTTDLYARVIKPVDFDASKKYPVMYYVYGGPHVQLVQNRWLGGADMFMHYMASQGYVVFTLDNRGSANRGLNFENATHRQLGTVELEDQMVGVNWLKSQSYVDADRMCVFGWSFGGFMTTSLMLRKPGTFKAGVAGGPVIDWKFYEIMYTERYMDTPEQNPDGYKTASLLNYVDQLKGRLLIIHGLQDDVVVPQHTATFVNECIAKNILIDYFPYPNHPHNVQGKDRVHLYKKVEDYFKQNVGTGTVDGTKKD